MYDGFTGLMLAFFCMYVCVCPLFAACNSLSRQFQCANDECIDRYYMCDGFAQCADSSDERDCRKYFISRLQCADCILRWELGPLFLDQHPSVSLSDDHVGGLR
jgi:Low-density lipoprotein receptor domain class A